MTTVLITGASGFIGRHLARALNDVGIRVVGTTRDRTLSDTFAKTYKLSLGESLKPVLEDETVYAIVHCANHAGEDEYRINIEGTRRWLE